MQQDKAALNEHDNYNEQQQEIELGTVPLVLYDAAVDHSITEDSSGDQPLVEAQVHATEIADNNNDSNSNTNADADVEFNGKKPTSTSSSVRNILTQYCTPRMLIGHLLLIIAQVFFTFWQTLGKFALYKFHPVVFTWFRCFITCVGLLPIMLLVDRKFAFNNNKSTTSSNGSVSSSKLWQFLLRKVPLPTSQQNRRVFVKLFACGVLLVLVNNVGFAIGLSLTDPVIGSIMKNRELLNFSVSF